MAFPTSCNNVALALLLAAGCAKTQVTPPADNTHARFVLEGVTLNESGLRAEIGHLSLRPARVLGFGLQAALELYAKDLHVRAQRAPKRDPLESMAQPLQTFAGENGRHVFRADKRIARITARNATLEFCDSQTCDVVVSATRVFTTPNGTQFEQVTFKHTPTDREVQAARAIYDKSLAAFVIPGTYRASSPKGTSLGRGLRITPTYTLSRG